MLSFRLYEGSDSDVSKDSNIPSPPPPIRRSTFREGSTRILKASGRNSSTALRRIRIRWVFEKLEENRNLVIKHRRLERKALQFRAFVLLLRYFCQWNDCTRHRKALITSNKKLLRVILIKWRVLSGESKSKLDAALMLIRSMKSLGLQKLHRYINVWKNCCCSMETLENSFSLWFARAKIRSEKKAMLGIKMDLRLSKSYFHSWKKYLIINVYERERIGRELATVFAEWKFATDEIIVARELKMRIAESFDEDRRFKLWSRMFEQLRKYAKRKRHYKIAYAMMATVYCDSLLRLSFHHWILYLELNRKKQRLVFKCLKRRVFFGWLRYTCKQKKCQRILVQMILNRWRIFSEDRVCQRNATLKALDHWGYRSCRLIMKSWNAIVIREKGRIRTPRRKYKSYPFLHYCNTRTQAEIQCHRGSLAFDVRNKPWDAQSNSTLNNIYRAERRETVNNNFGVEMNYRRPPNFKVRRRSSSKGRAGALSYRNKGMVGISSLNSLADFHTSAEGLGSLSTKPNANYSCHRPVGSRIPEWVAKAIAKRERSSQSLSRVYVTGVVDENKNRCDSKRWCSPKKIRCASVSRMVELAEAKILQGDLEPVPEALKRSGLYNLPRRVINHNSLH